MASRFGNVLGLLVLVLVLALTQPANAENIVIPANSVTPEITGYVIKPSGTAPAPAVLLLHGCDGLGPFEYASATALAKLGYVALAIDTLKPQGLTSGCSNPDAVAKSARYAYVSLLWLAAQPYVAGDRLGVLGFSMGAIEALSLVDPHVPHPPPPGLRVAVAFYPACANRSPNVTLPLLILDGDADDWTPAPPCQHFAADATAAGNTVKITTYPGATHGFNVPGDGQHVYEGHTLRYDPQAAADALAKEDAFFASYLRSP